MTEAKPQPPPVKSLLRFVTPLDGERTPDEFWVVLDVRVREILPSNPDAVRLHILIDQAPVHPGLPIDPAPNRIAFGAGRTNLLLRLEPGLHVLVAQATDAEGKALNVLDRIVIEVAPEGSSA